MEFIQIIEFNTSRIDEFNAALEEWLKQTAGQRAAIRGTQTKDRDRPNIYVQIVEFPSYEEAMANSNLPATSTFAAQLTTLCDSPPTFRNLDVTSREEM
jgi:quinol monooxygenase YgiN